MKRNLGKLLTSVFFGFLLIGCGNNKAFIEPDKGDLVDTSKDENTKICDSYKKLLKDSYPDVDSWNVEISTHIKKIGENISIDIMYATCDEYSVMEVTVDITFNGKYICTVGNSNYNMIVCNLDEEKSYTLNQAYDLKIINDDDINNICKSCKNMGSWIKKTSLLLE